MDLHFSVVLTQIPMQVFTEMQWTLPKFIWGKTI